MSPEQLAEVQTKRKKQPASESGLDTVAVGSGSQKHGSAFTNTTTIAIVGLGYVGLPLAILAATRGFKVIGFDVDEVKIAQLEKREANFLNEDENDHFQHAKSLFVTSDESRLKEADTFIVCVPTPVHEDHLPDL